MENILVTGGLGFVGTNLVEVLVRRHNQVTVIDNLCSESSSRAYMRPDVEYWIDDVRNLDRQKYAGRRFDRVFHLAGREADAAPLHQTFRRPVAPAAARDAALHQFIAHQRDDALAEKDRARIAVPVDAGGLAAVVDHRAGIGLQLTERLEPELAHREQQPAVHRLQPVAHVGQRARGDRRQRVGEIPLAQRVGEGHILDTGSNDRVGHETTLHPPAFAPKYGASMVLGL